jgi:large exoprotein involved in heme utilization and adhesion
LRTTESELGGAGQGGAINLTAANNIFITGGLSSYSFAVKSRAASGGSAANGGAISLFAGNGINITGDSYAYSLSEDGTADGTARNGGTISLVAVNSNISTGNLNSDSRSDNSSAANGGAINISATNGSISTGFLLSSSNSDFGVGANGGAITLEAANDIKIEGDLNSFSYSRLGTAGRGGAISLRTTGGDISGIRNQPTVLGSFSISEQGTAGKGGNVALEAKNNVRNLEILTLSSDSESGTVQVTGLGDLLLTNTNILTSKQVTVPKPFDTDGFLTLDVGEEGQSGDVTVTSSDNLTFNNSSIQSDTKGSDPAGDVTISSPGLVTFTNSQIISNTNSTGQAGNITIQAPEIQLDSSSSLSAQTSSNGSAGNLTLQPYDGGQTLSVLFQDGAQISASTSNQGIGGNIEIKAPDSVTIQGQGTITTSTTGTGNAGNITLDTSTLTIARGAQLFAFTEGRGNSGKIEVNASTAVNLGIGVDDFSPVLSVETSNAGKAGNITINTPSLTLSDTARITATATNTATNTAGGGSITLNASTMDLAGVVGVFAETQGQTPAGTLTLKPYQNQSTLNLTLAPQSQVSASTTGSGKGGNLIVQAPEAITIQGPGQLAVQTTGDGAAGDLRIDTQRLTIADGATISASTSSKNPNGTGGSIIINATESFNLTNQASLLAQSTGAAQAGNVIIKTEQLTANNGSITTSATATSLGKGGSIEVNASQINLSGTEIGLLAETQGLAPAGSLTLQPFENGQSLTINLQDNAKISAATSGSGEGGSLSVKAPEAITIRGPGQLSVETTGAGAAGNLSIDTQKLTIADGATISASTSSKNPEGVGGNLTINATQSFNLTNQARLLAQSTGAAPAGNITIHTGQLTANNGSIETSATQSAGGGITITASDIRLFGDSDIRTDVASGAGGGGNINLTANSIIAFGDSDILAYAADGKGGDITFKTPIFFGFAYSPAPKGTEPDTLDHNNQVDINATGAVNGVISLPNLSFIQNSLTELPSNQIDTDSLLANSCIVRRNQPTRGSFTITGTGGLPQRPGDAQISSFPTVDVETLPSEDTPTNTNPNGPWQKGDPIVEPQGVYRLPNGKLVMSRECPQ